MKKLFVFFYIFILSCGLCRAADGDLFPYPQPPADMERLDERCDFIVSRFWRQCNFKSAMSHHDKLRSTFADWVSLMPFANADTVHNAINNLIASVQKNDRQLLEIGKLARELTYSDEAEIHSAEIFLPFAKAVAENKKISAVDKAPFVSAVQKIENSAVGKNVRHLDYTLPDGSKGNIDNIHTQMIVLYFNRHDDEDGSFGSVRLSADYNIRTLVDRGLLTIVCIEPGSPSRQWQDYVSSLPSEWVCGASADANQWFELDTLPSIMLIDGRHKVLAKDMTVDDLMRTMANIRQNTGL